MKFAEHIFCMTKSADDLLNRSAYDFYSYIKLVVVFQDEFAKTSEQQTLHLLFHI